MDTIKLARYVAKMKLEGFRHFKRLEIDLLRWPRRRWEDKDINSRN